MPNSKEDYDKAVEESFAFMQQILTRTAMEQQQGKSLDTNVLAEDINKFIIYMSDNYGLDKNEIIGGIDKAMQSDIPDKLSAMMNEQIEKQKREQNGNVKRENQIHDSAESSAEKEEREERESEEQ